MTKYRDRYNKALVVDVLSFEGKEDYNGWHTIFEVKLPGGKVERWDSQSFHACFEEVPDGT